MMVSDIEYGKSWLEQVKKSMPILFDVLETNHETGNESSVKLSGLGDVGYPLKLSEHGGQVPIRAG